jgi:hypothetical protein
MPPNDTASGGWRIHIVLVVFDVFPEPGPVFEGDLKRIVVGPEPWRAMRQRVHHFHLEVRAQSKEGHFECLRQPHVARSMVQRGNQDPSLLIIFRFSHLPLRWRRISEDQGYIPS